MINPHFVSVHDGFNVSDVGRKCLIQRQTRKCPIEHKYRVMTETKPTGLTVSTPGSVQ